MPLYRLSAIVLHTFPFQETHFLVTLLSPTKGKIRALAKGCRRLQSSLGHAIQPMVQANFLLAEGKNLDIITQAEIKTVFPGVREDLERLTHGLFAMELVDRFIEEPEPQSKPYYLLLRTLEALESRTPAPLLLRSFEANLLRLLGYAPLLEACVQCNKNIGLTKFSSRLGGMLCIDCQDIDKQSLSIDSGSLQALRACFQSNMGDPVEIPLRLLQEITGIIHHYMEEKSGKIIHGFKLVQAVDSISQGFAG